MAERALIDNLPIGAACTRAVRPRRVQPLECKLCAFALHRIDHSPNLREAALAEKFAEPEPPADEWLLPRRTQCAVGIGAEANAAPARAASKALHARSRKHIFFSYL